MRDASDLTTCCVVLRPVQEEAEGQLPGMPTQQPPASAVSRKGVHFADSVRRVEDEPCAARVGGLTTPVLVVMMASLAYLADTLQVSRHGRALRSCGSWLGRTELDCRHLC